MMEEVQASAEMAVELYIATRHRSAAQKIVHYDDCRPSETVGEVKGRIEAKYGIAIRRQALWLGPKLMRNHRTLASYKIHPAVPAIAHLEIANDDDGGEETIITVTLRSLSFPTQSRVKTLTCKETDTVGELRKRILARFSGHSRFDIELFFDGTMLGEVDAPLLHYLVSHGAVISVHYEAGPRVDSSERDATENLLLFYSLQASS
ncbi:unnamed protein product [Linum trigynum]|uniref:Ubiquitin-like domain-containing protein n=1 Tax=Linum trigynum TaxID=586398 RepID=A0AAV2DG10_9ROSI